MTDYEKFFSEKGITSPEDQKAMLDYMRGLFEIAADVVLKGGKA